MPTSEKLRVKPKHGEKGTLLCLSDDSYITTFNS